MKKLIGGLGVVIALVGLFSFVMVEKASASPGRTDRYGCHVCRTNCRAWGLRTGQYHCHYKK